MSGSASRSYALLVVLGAIAVALVVVVGLLVTASAGWTRGELQVLIAIGSLHTPALTAMSLAINAAFTTTNAVIIVVVVGAVLALLARPTVALEFVLLIVITWLGTQLLKAVVHRPRPDAALLPFRVLHESTFSYPSGHTALATSLAATLVVLVWRAVLHARWRVVAVLVGSLVALATAFSRMYLGVHYPTDVVASLVYATATVIALDATWKRFAEPRLRRS